MSSNSTVYSLRNLSPLIGYAAIINNNNFVKDDFGDRGGLDSDVEALRRCLVSLRFKVEVHNNCDALAMRSIVKDYALRRNHEPYDCFLCFIISYGTSANKHIYGTDCEANALGDLIEPFNDCLSLRGKPKLFFVEATEPPATRRPKFKELFEDAAATTPSKKLSLELDTLVYFASVESLGAESSIQRRRSLTKLFSRRRLSGGGSSVTSGSRRNSRSDSPDPSDPLHNKPVSFLVESFCHVVGSGEQAAQRSASDPVDLKTLLVGIDARVKSVHGKPTPLTFNMLGKAFYFENSKPESSIAIDDQQDRSIALAAVAATTQQIMFEWNASQSSQAPPQTTTTATVSSSNTTQSTQQPIQVIHLVTPSPLQINHSAVPFPAQFYPPATSTQPVQQQQSQPARLSQQLINLPQSIQLPQSLSSTQFPQPIQSLLLTQSSPPTPVSPPLPVAVKSDYSITSSGRSAAASDATKKSDGTETIKQLKKIRDAFWADKNYPNFLAIQLDILKVYENERRGNSRDHATCLKNVAIAYFVNNNFRSNLEYGNKALDMYKRMGMGEDKEVADCIHNIGVTHSALGENAQFLECMLTALKIYENASLGDKKDVADCLKNTGFAFYNTKDYKNDLTYSLRALGMYERLNPEGSKDTADCLRHVGMAYIRCNDYEYGLRFELKALELYNRLGVGLSEEDIATCLKYITYGYFFTRDPTNELNYALKALDLVKKLYPAESSQVADCLKRVQIAFLRNNDIRQGLAIGLRAIAIYDKLKLVNQDVFQCLRNTAFACLANNDTINATLCTRKASTVQAQLQKQKA